MKASDYFNFSSFIFIAFLAYSFQILETIYCPGSIPLAFGYLLLFTPFRDYNLEIWKRYVKYDKEIVYPARPIPEILAKDFTYENIQKATNNFRVPAVVRGMFKGTRAVELWPTEDYLPQQFKDFTIPIVRNARVGTMQDDRVLVKFTDAFDEMYHSNASGQYIFFPVKSRFTFPGAKEGNAQLLQDKVDEICREDLDFNHRFWSGFGDKTRHRTYLASQMVIGKSTPTFSPQTTGSDWHCAGGNNWFIQVAGRKHWELIEPRYSHYLYPLKGGFFNMWTGNKNMAEMQKHVPRFFVDLEPGDMMYNPDWMWHKITNYGGLSIGVPVREMNATLLLQNNKIFTLTTFTNQLLLKVGLQLGGYPPPSAQTEQDN